MVKMLRVGNNRKAHGCVKDRMFATKFQLAIESNFAAMTPQERMSPLARNLSLVYAFCLTLHLPKTQSIPYIYAENRTPFDVEGCDDTLFEDMFKFTKSEFDRLINVGLTVADKDDQGEIVRHAGVDNNDNGIVATRQRVTVSARDAFLISDIHFRSESYAFSFRSPCGRRRLRVLNAIGVGLCFGNHGHFRTIGVGIFER
jgi:hypothetical protein